MMTRALRAGSALAVAACAVAISGGSLAAGSGVPTGHTSSTRLTVLAAASLSKVLPKVDPRPKYTFAGSGMLETEIQQGAPADVFAAASPKQTAELYAAGLVYRPVRFATNTLVMIVAKDNPKHIKSVSDITKKGIKIVVCNPTVPCGAYASTAFANLGITAAATKNVVSQQTDVTQVVAQIAAGQGDVGFVYVTDAKAANGKVTAIKLPAKAKPLTMDTIAVVKATTNRSAAQGFVASLLSAKGQKILKAAGFGPR